MSGHSHVTEQQKLIRCAWPDPDRSALNSQERRRSDDGACHCQVLQVKKAWRLYLCQESIFESPAKASICKYFLIFEKVRLNHIRQFLLIFFLTWAHNWQSLYKPLYNGNILKKVKKDLFIIVAAAAKYGVRIDWFVPYWDFCLKILDCMPVWVGNLWLTKVVASLSHSDTRIHTHTHIPISQAARGQLCDLGDGERQQACRADSAEVDVESC